MRPFTPTTAPNAPTNLAFSRRALLHFAASAAGVGLVSACGGRLLSSPSGPVSFRTSAPLVASGAVTGAVGRVLVLGAGFAGLAAANALKSAGVDVVVLEARDRLGGRASTVEVAGSQFDLGAAWIHEPIGNPLAAMSRAIGASTQRFSLEDLVAGSSVNTGAAGWLRKADLSAIATALDGIEKTAMGLFDKLGPEAKLGLAIDLHLAGLPIAASHRATLRSIIQIVVGTTFNAAADSLWLGAVTGDELVYQGSDVLVEGGFKVLIDSLAQGVPVVLGGAVRRVEQRADGVSVLLSDGRVEIGTHVVMTVPLGVLKSGTIEFDPPLPAAHSEAIQQLGFGRFEKLVLRTTERSWSEFGSDVLFTLADPRSPIPSWMDWSGPAGAPALIGFAAGDAATLHDSYSSESLLARARADLEAAVGPLNVEGTASSGWSQDPWARGGYPYLTGSASPGHIRTLSEPSGRLLLAGDHTNWPRYYATDGAFTSGIRAAQRLLRVSEVTLSLGRAA